jgi:hypothetical protein
MLRAAPGSLACGRCAGWFAEGRIWVKVSGAYRVSRLYPDYPDAQPIHEALVAANPDQITWGTDWPHPRLERDMPDDGHLLDLSTAGHQTRTCAGKSWWTIRRGCTASNITALPAVEEVAADHDAAG